MTRLAWYALAAVRFAAVCVSWIVAIAFGSVALSVLEAVACGPRRGW